MEYSGKFTQVEGEREWEFNAAFADPNATHSDSDNLNDYEEYTGWEIDPYYEDPSDADDPCNVPDSVVISADGSLQPYRYDYADEQSCPNSSGNWTIRSDALDADSDKDGLNDTEERMLLSNPHKKVSYGITEEHQTHILESARDINSWSLRCGDLQPRLSLPEDSCSESFTLNDATDDWDFVTTDEFSLKGRVQFTGLNNQQISDVWYSNSEELHRDGPGGSTNPWDPDSDNDGLTDGHEVVRIPIRPLSNLNPSSRTVSTNPTTPDTDGDGYWDGWIGVHGVGNTDNVVLYMENLQSGNGVENDEIVQEQVGVHKVTSDPMTASARTVDLYTTDSDQYHSNIHLGELTWGTSPTSEPDDPGDESNLEIEMDTLDGQSRYGSLPPASQNFRLYGLDITYDADDNVPSEVPRVGDGQEWRGLRYHLAIDEGLHRIADNVNSKELDIIEDFYHSDPSGSAWAFWGSCFSSDTPSDEWDALFTPNNCNNYDGLAWDNGDPLFNHWSKMGSDWGFFIYGDNVDGTDEGQHVVMHETAHIIGIGYDDDKEKYDRAIGGAFGVINVEPNEVPSGNQDTGNGPIDETPEEIDNPHELNGDGTRWSIMAYNDENDLYYEEEQVDNVAFNRRYVFSIEELRTVAMEEVVSRED